MTESVPDALSKHAAAALEEIREGRHPTADALVHRVGGSKTTAVTELRLFWQDVLPAIIRATTTDAPDPVRQLAGEIWTRALLEARREAQTQFAERKTELARANDRAQAAIQSAHRERDAALASRDGLRQQLVGAREAQGRAEERVAQMKEALATTTKDLEACATARRDVETQLVATRTRWEATQAALTRSDSDRELLRERIEALEATVLTVQRDLTSATTERDLLRQAGDQLRQQIADNAKTQASERAALTASHQQTIDQLLLRVDRAETAARKAKPPAPRSTRKR